MKRFFTHLSFYFITLLLICQALALPLFASNPVSAYEFSPTDTNDFYFTDANFDYHLTKTENGNKLHVKETLTAEFPDFARNHGITRSIPYTNQDGKNTTVASESALNLTVKRNDAIEPYSISKEDNYYLVRIGSASSYVTDTQTYTLEYDFENVITEFSDGLNVSGKNQNSPVDFQELYWDTNGTGWEQPFNKLTATLHVDQPNDLLNEAWCYVGRYGTKGEGRCEITRISDGYRFEASNLKGRENLTFVTQFKPGTYQVILQKNWLLVIFSIILVAFCFFILLLVIRRWQKKAKAKVAYYKKLFVAPQYTVPKEITVAESGQLSLKSTKPSYVATMLELAVNGYVSLVKGEPTKILKKDTWRLHINKVDGLTTSQTMILRILKGGEEPVAGEEFDIKKHTATYTLQSYIRTYRSSAFDDLKTKGLLEGKASSAQSNISTAIIVIVIFSIFIPGILISLSELSEGLLSFSGYVVGSSFLPLVDALVVVATIIVGFIFGSKTSKYGKYTEAGLDMNNYLEGLRLYIDMAEEDRIKFLQSTKGADTSPKGIVKLYEKLLPYACIFGLEDSWMKELNKYYQMPEVSDPTWYDSTDALIDIAVFNSIYHDVNSAVVASTSYSEPSSSSSSGSSGGGGGGFSGGGGGGGGGGGW